MPLIKTRPFSKFFPTTVVFLALAATLLQAQALLIDDFSQGTAVNQSSVTNFGPVEDTDLDFSTFTTQRITSATPDSGNTGSLTGVNVNTGSFTGRFRSAASNYTGSVSLDYSSSSAVDFIGLDTFQFAILSLSGSLSLRVFIEDGLGNLADGHFQINGIGLQNTNLTTLNNWNLLDLTDIINLSIDFGHSSVLGTYTLLPSSFEIDSITAIPESSTLLLLSVGVLGLAVIRPNLKIPGAAATV
jgi:hypothetical protein